jgi:transcriptional regulator with XRE-family HTH domain
MAPNNSQPLRKPPIDGALIRELRLEKVLSLPEAAERVGCTPKHLGRIERGVRGGSEILLRKIARAYGVKPDEIRTRSEVAA